MWDDASAAGWKSAQLPAQEVERVSGVEFRGLARLNNLSDQCRVVGCHRRSGQAFGGSRMNF